MTHADRRRQGRRAGACARLQVGAARDQALDDGKMSAAGGTQQGRAALVIHRINGQIEIEQSLHGFGRTGHRRRRQVRRLQASSR